MKTYTITGQVIATRTQKGIAGLKVEAWDKDLLFNDLVGSAVTDESGAFSIEFTQKHFKECFLDRKPDLFFKVYKGRQLITSTEDSVLWNIKKSKNDITIEVEMPLKDAQGDFLVKGAVFRSDQSPLAEVVVRAIDKDLRHEQALGQAITDGQGYYEIRYTRDQFRRAEKQSADLIVRAYDPETGQLLLDESNIIFNAGPVEVVDLIAKIFYSEYERYMAELTPIRDGVPVADLTEKDIHFLHGETGIAAHHIEFLSIATCLSKQTDLPAEIFYGLFRQKLPTVLSDLLETDVEELEAALHASFKTHIIPLHFQKDLEDYLKRLSKLKETDPDVHRKKENAKFRRLLKMDDLDDVKVDAVVEKVGHVTLVNDKLLKSMVEAEELKDSEAKSLGLTVTLSNLLDDNRELVKHLKTGTFSSIPEGKIQHVEDLIAFEKSDWLEILEQEEVQPPDGWSREGYSALLTKKIENLYPTKTMFTRVMSKTPDNISQDLNHLHGLFDRYENLFSKSFDDLDVSGMDDTTIESLRTCHNQLNSLANTYPGLDLYSILNDPQISADAKDKQIHSRIETIPRFCDQNPDKELLFLDYSPESSDIEELDFSGFDEAEKRMVLKTVKAYQRMYSVTRDASHSEFLISQGHHSALSIANMSREDFQTSTGLNEPVAMAYYGNACSIAIKQGVGLFGMVDSVNKWYQVDNTDHQSLSEYLKKIDGWEALFGSLDYCKCEHCRSIFSPAAYFVDLMRFLEKNVFFEGSGSDESVAWETSAGFRAREDHPLHLKRRRPDLWKLPLTCENTNQLIPYLDIINEALENDIYERMGHDTNDMPEVGADRSAVENEVYGALEDSAKSFRQPFSLGLQRLNTYLAHFDVTREEVARLLDESRDVIAAAAFKLSSLEFVLITEPNYELENLISLYGLNFVEDSSAGELVFFDPTLQSDDFEIIEEYNKAKEESKNDVQLLLKAIGLTRAELGTLITTEFVLSEYYQYAEIVGGEVNVEIHSEKRVAEGEDASVQNDIERIQGLSERALERMHRFTRLWRQLPWTINELDLVLKKIADTTADNNIQSTTLQNLTDILLLQRRFNLAIEDVCALWDMLPDESFVEGGQSIFDRLFNLPDFVKLNGKWSEEDPVFPVLFLHPAFRNAPPPDPEVDYTLHRLLAGLRVDDDQLHALIVELNSLLGLNLESDDTEDKDFDLDMQNLSLLYRHARIAEAIKLQIPDLFQLIRLAPAIPEDHIESLAHLLALIDFYDWWKSTEYTLDDLAFIMDGPVAEPENYPDAEMLKAKIVRQAKVNQALTFNHTMFAFLEGVTEEQSQKIIAENTGAIVEVPGTGYRVSRAFSPAVPIHIPGGLAIEATEDEIRGVLATHNTPDSLPFEDTVFTTIVRVPPVTEEQSRALVAANLGIFDNAPGTRYCVAEGLNDTSEIVIPEMPPDEAPILADPLEVRNLLLTYHTDSMPVFDDTLFTAIAEVTEDHSRAIIAANPKWIIPAPLENAYWLTHSYSAASLLIPEGKDIPITEKAAKELLSTYHATSIIPSYLASELGLPTEKINALINLAGIDLDNPIFTDVLRGETPDESILEHVSTLLPLTILFKDKAFDREALEFIKNDNDHVCFGITDITDLSFENVRMVSMFLAFLKKLDEREIDPKNLFDLLVAFIPSKQKFYLSETSEKKDIQQWLAEVLDAEVGLAITAHDEIDLADKALDALTKLESCLELVIRLGVGGDVLILVVSNDNEKLNKAANAILSAFRAKYDNEDEWKEKIEPFEDKIRVLKRDALTDYLIHSLDPKPFSTLHDLYHHFLIDVELEGCARTSRVVAANSSVQLYVHRILLNIEQDRAGALRARMTEDAIQEWKWRKNYRVWEANRKIFLYPENYLEPDLRDNKTHLFEELESTLLQQEINEDTVIDAYAQYMRGFGELANLKIAGSYHNIGSECDFLHLFGVTVGDPIVYYYRVAENAYIGERDNTKGTIWHPWRKIDVQIPVRKVSPIVFNGKLHVFWVEYNTQPYNELVSGTSKFTGYDHTMSIKFAKLKIDGSWTQPQSIMLNNRSPFESGNGVIHDPLETRIIEGWIAPNLPRYGHETHIKPKNGYFLDGILWDRVYPENCSDTNLLVYGADFQMIAEIEFYKRCIVEPPDGLDLEDLDTSKLLYSDEDRKLYSIQQAGYYFFCPYAYCSILSEESRIRKVWERHTYISEDNLRSGTSSGVHIANLKHEDEIEIISGSPSDCIIDSTGDLLLLQTSVRDGRHYLLKRIGTTIYERLSKELFSSGVEGILDTAFQEGLEESPNPLEYDEEDGYIENAVSAGCLHFEGPYGVYYREIFFHIPFLIANHLNSQGKFAEAQKWYHYIFNPTAQATDMEGPKVRNWRYLEFRGRDVESMRDIFDSPEAISTYKKDPFNSHAIARLRLSAYQKAIVMKYNDNLLDWGDHLFAQDTMESINEATLLYVLASSILGERPAELGQCGEAPAKSYAEISLVLDEQDNEFLMEMYHIVQGGSSNSGSLTYTYAPDPASMNSASKNAHDHITNRCYTTMGHLPTGMDSSTSEESGSSHFSAEDMEISAAEDSLMMKEGLFKGTHWMDFNRSEDNANYIHGFVIPFTFQLGPVFCIPPNKDLHGYWDRVEDRLFKIRNCLNISGVRRGLSLFAPEIDPMLLVRAKAAGLSLEDVLNSISGNLPPYRFSYIIERAKGYAAILQGFGSALLSALEKKDIENLNQMRTAHQQNILKQTRQIRQWEIDAASEACNALYKRKVTVEFRKDHYDGLIEERLIPAESIQLVSRLLASSIRGSEALIAFLCASLALIPESGSPFAMVYGGRELNASGRGYFAAMEALAKVADNVAASSSLVASFQRREEVWQYQSDLSGHELNELEKQIRAAEIRLEIANRGIEIHDQTVEQLDEVYEFYQDKFTNLGLYTWLSNNLQSLYREAYNNAYAMAKLAEQAYRFERGNDAAELIGPSHWDASKAGLLSGERLLMDLQNLERKFLETNYRTIEIDQAFSLTQIDPAALIELKQTGSCQFSIPEIYFNLFYPGHYRRKIKAVRLTLPCITGPYTNVSANLRLTGSEIHIEPDIDANLLQIPLTRTVAIATSTAQNDAGVFELNFHDERYMPFEGAGAISKWDLSLPKSFRQFDYNTINDVILHISYTAEEDSALRSSVEGTLESIEGSINEFLTNDSSDAVGLQRIFSLRQEFSSAFNTLLHSPVDQQVTIELTDRHFPIFLKGRALNVRSAFLVLGTEKDQEIGTFQLSFNNSDIPSDTNEKSFQRESDFGDLFTVNVTDLIPESTLSDGQIIKSPIGEHSITIKNAGGPPSPDSPVIEADKLEDIYIYLEYGLN